MESDFASMVNDGASANRSKSTEEDGASMEESCAITA